MLAERTDLRVGPGGLGRHGDLDAVASGGGRLRVGPRSFHAAADAAEEVHLVGDIQDVVEDPEGLGRAARELEDLVGGAVAAVLRAEIQVGLRVLAVARRLQRGPGERQIGLGDREVLVGRQGVGHQLVEERIVIELPPGVGRLRGAFEGGGHRDQRRGGPVWQGGRLLVRAQDAAAQGQEDDRGGERPTHHEFASRRANSGMCEAGPIGAGR